MPNADEKEKLEKCETSDVDVHGGTEVVITLCKVQHAHIDHASTARLRNDTLRQYKRGDRKAL
jgi:hypothetical protein